MSAILIKSGNPNARTVPILMIDSSSSSSAGKTGLTGAAIGTVVTCNATTGVAGSLTIKYSINGGSYAAASGTIVEQGGGTYFYKPPTNTAETNTTNDVTYWVVATGAIDYIVTISYSTYKLDDIAVVANASVWPANFAALSIDSAGRLVLTPAEHTNVVSDVEGGLTAQGYSTARAGYLDTLNNLVSAIWSAATRTLSSIGTVAANVIGWGGGALPTSFAANNLPTFPANFSSMRIASGGQVDIDLGEALDLTQTTNTVGGALTAASAQGFGKWVTTGNYGTPGATLKIYDSTGTTLLHTFDISTGGTRQ